MTEALSPTKERLSKNDHWDTPEVDSATNRKAYKSVDDVTRAWRQGKLEFAHFQSWEHFVRHWEGAQKHDVRVSDTTGDPAGASDRMPPWQFHGAKLAQARSTLTPLQFQALELMCQGWGFREVGLNYSPYRTRQQAESYALGKIEGALDILAYLWSLKLRQKVPIRP
jgi:hypothetical protein